VLFFALSKTLDLLAAPLTWALLLLLSSAWGTYRMRRTLALSSLFAAFAVLYAFSSSTIANALVRALESPATTTMSGDAPYDAVVVLGGLVGPSSTLQSPDYGEAVDRLLAGYDIVRTDRARSILVTSDAKEAPTLARQLVLWGIAPERIVTDDESRNTHDNAVESARIIRGRGWTRILLVTSALHMPRAAGCFHAAGLTFDTLVVDRLAPPPDAPESVGPRADTLNLSTMALREALGRAVYWAVGYAR
jgi:uncharacterized SAM-binding protein YcdF (DUF218 family)